MTTATAHQVGVDRYNVRKPDRLNILLSTNLRLSNQPDVAIDVKNISNRGFMAVAERDLPIGSDAMLYLPGIGWALANIRWSLGNRFGARFSESIDMRQFWRANPPKRVSFLRDVSTDV